MQSRIFNLLAMSDHGYVVGTRSIEAGPVAATAGAQEHAITSGRTVVLLGPACGARRRSYIIYGVYHPARARTRTKRSPKPLNP